MKELTEKQKRFCEEYVKDFNASRAAVDAGYSRTSSRSTSSAILTNPNTRIYIKELTSKITTNSLVTTEMVLLKISKIGFDDGEKVSVRDRLKALELLGRHLGMFRDKVDVTTNGQSITPTTIVFNSTGVAPITSEKVLLEMLDNDRK